MTRCHGDSLIRSRALSYLRHDTSPLIEFMIYLYVYFLSVIVLDFVQVTGSVALFLKLWKLLIEEVRLDEWLSFKIKLERIQVLA